MKRIASNLDLPEHVKAEAMKIYKKALHNKLLRGRSIYGIVAASLYYACRKRRIPRTLQEIMDETSESSRDVRRCYGTLIKELNLKLPTCNPEFYVPRYVAELGLELEIEQLTTQIIREFMSKFSTSGKDPKGICAGAIYLVAKFRNEKISQKDISNVVGITEVTLRSRYKELLNSLNLFS